MAKAKNKLWFVSKKYGWGWRPSTWQGWLVLFVYLIFNFLFFKKDDPYFYVKIILSTLILIGTCWLKGEKPRWRWGK